MTTETLEQFSDALADLLAEAAPFTVAIRTGRRDRSGILWRDDVVVTSEQLMPEGPNFTAVHNGAEIQANPMLEIIISAPLDRRMPANGGLAVGRLEIEKIRAVDHIEG